MKGNTLYWKLSGIFLLLLFAIGVSYFWITRQIARDYLDEVNQRLYGAIADSTVNLVPPIINGQVDKDAMKDIMHSMMVINPSVEVYLLDNDGTILTYLAPNKVITAEKVDLNPIEQFIQQAGKGQMVKGDDPRNPGEKKVFSAARVMEEGTQAGYLYIVLASEEQFTVSSTLFNSYILRIGVEAFFLSLVGALAVGLIVFWFLTRNLERISQIVWRFKNGDYSARIPGKMANDFPRLTDSFNEMADTIVENIDELKKLERLRRELVANVSHDLRTPLAIIQGYIETMQMKNANLSEAERAEYLDIIFNSSNRLSNLVTQLFEYSKLEAREIELEAEPFLLPELAQDIVKDYQVLAEGKQIDLTVCLKQKVPMVEGDVGLIERVFQNLLDNAIKFTPKGGEICVDWKRHDTDWVQVRLVDSGPGIPAEEQEVIFDRYRQTDENSQKEVGMGLGLAIARKIMELHGSKIALDPSEENGASFLFFLPVYHSGKESVIQANPTKATSDLKVS